jgi:hypothetical protein
MLGKARITFGLALLIAGLAVIGRQVTWIAVPLVLLAIFLIVWGREQRATEAFIKDLPLGHHILKIMQQIDTILVPHDREYNQHVKRTIQGYDVETRRALRILYRTRNTNSVLNHLPKFVADGFIEYPKDGPGWIRPELRDVISRTLDELGG